MTAACQAIAHCQRRNYYHVLDAMMVAIEGTGIYS